jgi:DNA-directed RNA polymerase alpha subunit
MNFSDVIHIPISELGLSIRAYNALRRSGFDTIGDILSLDDKQIPPIRGIGSKLFGEITDAINTYLQNDVAVYPIESQNDVYPSTGTSIVRISAKEHIEKLLLPKEVVNELRLYGITTVDDLAMLRMSAVVSLGCLHELREEHWSKVISKLKKLKLHNLSDHRGDENTKFSLLCLNLSTRTLNPLLRSGINDINLLSQVTLASLTEIKNFGPKCFLEVIAKMSIYLSKASYPPENLTSTIPMHNQEQYEKSGILPLDTKTTVRDVIDEWLLSLKERSREIIALRSGLIDGHIRTLEDVGKIYGLTRERVRQIEARAISQFRRHFPRPVMQQLFENIRCVIIENGGLATEKQLADSLNSHLDVGNISTPNLIRLLITSNGDFHWEKALQAWCLSDHLADLSINIVSEALKILSQEQAPISWDEFLRRLKSTDWFEHHEDEVSDNLILASINCESHIVQYDDGNFGLEKWERHYLDDIILTLRRLGKPSHFSEIAKAMNSSLPPDKKVTSRSIQAQLLHYSVIFVWIGRRGTYGLKEWGLERSLTYEEALTQILEDAGHPLTFQEILAKLPEVRPFYDESSIVLSLGTNRTFKGFPNNTFGLAKWQEDDLMTEGYRVKRLLNTGEELYQRKPKKQVVEALDSMDSFIAQLRGN